MSLRELDDVSPNPYDPPHAESRLGTGIVRKRLRWWIPACWVIGGALLQACAMAFVLYFRHIKTPMLPLIHVFITLAAIVATAFWFLKRYNFWPAMVTAQLFNAAQWGTLVLSVKGLSMFFGLQISLAPTEKQVFVGIFALTAIGLLVLSFVKRSGSGDGHEVAAL